MDQNTVDQNIVDHKGVKCGPTAGLEHRRKLAHKPVACREVVEQGVGVDCETDFTLRSCFRFPTRGDFKNNFQFVQTVVPDFSVYDSALMSDVSGQKCMLHGTTHYVHLTTSC